MRRAVLTQLNSPHPSPPSDGAREKPHCAPCHSLTQRQCTPDLTRQNEAGVQVAPGDQIVANDSAPGVEAQNDQRFFANFKAWNCLLLNTTRPLAPEGLLRLSP